MPSDLTLSIINHSNPEMLRDCLRSLFAATHRVTLDVWVVDNATDGALVPELQAEFPQVRWLFNTERLGFSANHNQVLSQASGRYACILNDDIVVHDGAFDTLIEYMDAHPKVGMAGAKLLNSNGTLQDCTFRFMTLWSELVAICLLPGPLNALKKVMIDPAQTQDRPALVDWVLGACIVVRAAALREIGLLDAVLSPVANMEEVDWCYRAHQAGWEVGYCPDAVLTHFGGQSQKLSKPGANRFRVEMYRTRIAFFRKHHGAAQTVLLRGIYLITVPWNAFMLAQSALRRTEPFGKCLAAFATLCGIAMVSLRFRQSLSFHAVQGADASLPRHAQPMNKPGSPQISVIVPTCHRNDLLAKCLDCLAPGVQTLPADQYEVIVTDDGSRSTAQRLVEENYPWVRWVQGPRQGPAANRNHGAATAQGEWLAFTDDDCLPEQDWLAAYLAALSEGVQVYEGKTTCQAGITSPLYQAPVNLTGGCLWSCNFMISSDLFHSIGGFDTDFAMPAVEDIDLHDRLTRQGEHTIFVETAVVDHPPRRANSGWKMGKMYEAKVQYWNKRGLRGRSLIAYFKHLKHYLHWLKQFGFHRDLALAYYALLTEIVYVVPRLSMWERKYQTRYRDGYRRVANEKT